MSAPLCGQLPHVASYVCVVELWSWRRVSRHWDVCLGRHLHQGRFVRLEEMRIAARLRQLRDANAQPTRPTPDDVERVDVVSAILSDRMLQFVEGRDCSRRALDAIWGLMQAHVGYPLEASAYERPTTDYDRADTRRDYTLVEEFFVTVADRLAARLRVTPSTNSSSSSSSSRSTVPIFPQVTTPNEAAIGSEEDRATCLFHILAHLYAGDPDLATLEMSPAADTVVNDFVTLLYYPSLPYLRQWSEPSASTLHVDAEAYKAVYEFVMTVLVGETSREEVSETPPCATSTPPLHIYGACAAFVRGDWRHTDPRRLLWYRNGKVVDDAATYCNWLIERQLIVARLVCRQPSADPAQRLEVMRSWTVSNRLDLVVHFATHLPLQLDFTSKPDVAPSKEVIAPPPSTALLDMWSANKATRAFMRRCIECPSVRRALLIHNPLLLADLVRRRERHLVHLIWRHEPVVFAAAQCADGSNLVRTMQNMWGHALFSVRRHTTFPIEPLAKNSRMASVPLRTSLRMLSIVADERKTSSSSSLDPRAAGTSP